ncbi:hypothetical protein H4Q32_014566 [Labeo rohita]|uniref:Uncharacterized protein n=1 Tax=Labeo rohita TaxID=84645 RepID=A0ABQ8LME0_LABRO|nr:hypothetical protein H4Q32_014566 [Labeo rohita]
MTVEVCELATTPTTSCAPPTATWLVEDLGLFEAEGVLDWDIYADLPPLLPPSLELTETCLSSALGTLTNAHPLLPPPPLSSGSPSAHPQSSIYVVGSPLVCQSPLALQLEDPLSLPPASKSRTPPWPFDPSAPPWLLAPSSPPWPGSPLSPPGSLVHPAQPWAVAVHPAPRDSTPPASPRPSGSTSVLRILLVYLAHRLCVSTSGCSAAIAPPSVVSFQDSVRRPPPEPPAKFPSMPPSVVVYSVRTRLPGGGRYVRRTLDLSHHTSEKNPLPKGDMKGQMKAMTRALFILLQTGQKSLP